MHESKLILRVIYFAIALFGEAAHAQQPLTGIEVLGNHLISREVVLADFPIRIGDAFGPDFDSYRTWCNNLKVRLNVSFAGCSIVGYPGGQRYAAVDLVEKEDQKTLAAPERRDIVLNAKLYGLSQRITALWIEKMKAGIIVKTSTTDFMVFDDADMNTLARELSRQAPSAKQDIFEVLQYSRDDSQREAAANLLKWCGDPAAGLAIVHRPDYFDE